MKTLSEALQPFVDQNVLAGAVVLAAGPDKVHALEAVGYSDVAAKKLMKTDDLFWIASTTKPMTATALMMLVEEGKISLDDPVGKYLPMFQGQMVVAEKDDDHILLKKPKNVLTVKHLVNHTSGLPVATPMHWRFDLYSLRESVISYALTPLAFEPGTRYAYGNGGLNTAGHLIEIVSKQSYADFMDSRLLQPLGMTETTMWPSETQLPRLAKAYQANKEKTALEETPISMLTPPYSNRARHPFPGGGYFSTASDMLKFAQMIMNGGVHNGKRLLSKASVDLMTSKQTGELADNYGLGWGTAPPAGFGHGGALGNQLWINPEEQLITIYLIQHAGFPGPDGNPPIHAAFKQVASELYGKR